MTGVEHLLCVRRAMLLLFLCLFMLTKLDEVEIVSPNFFFVLPPFEDNGLLFWAPDILC